VIFVLQKIRERALDIGLINIDAISDLARTHSARSLRSFFPEATAILTQKQRERNAGDNLCKSFHVIKIWKPGAILILCSSRKPLIFDGEFRSFDEFSGLTVELWKKAGDLIHKQQVLVLLQKKTLTVRLHGVQLRHNQVEPNLLDASFEEVFLL
jgi:hypothetical protein